MALEKLMVVPEVGPSVTARFNPERYSVSKSVHLGEVNIPGLDAPVLQFVRGKNEKISFELHFDTTEHGLTGDVVDVRELTRPLYRLLKVASETHAPPRCLLFWGEAGTLFSFGSNELPWCVLDNLSQEFNLFSPGGVPLRARVDASFCEAWTIEEQLRETPRHSSTRTKVRTLEAGQSLSHLAGVEYGDPRAWRRIAESNGIDNPRTVAPGRTLTIPRAQLGGR